MSRAVFYLQSPEDPEDVGAPTPAEVTLTGEVDASNVAEFARSVRDLPGVRPVILQLSNVKYLDSAGFAALDRLIAEKAIVIVLSPGSFMYRVATLMCMPIHDDAEAARRVLQDGAS
jgi:anti-sigma B factor antagonist